MEANWKVNSYQKSFIIRIVRFKLFQTTNRKFRSKNTEVIQFFLFTYSKISFKYLIFMKVGPELNDF